MTEMDNPYSNREIDRMFKEIKDQLDRIELQTTKTNGKVRRHDRILLVLTTMTIVILFLKFPELLGLIKLLF